MNPQDRIHLLSELTFLREHLAELPDSAKIMRISTESRIRGIENRLAEEPVNEREPERVQLTVNDPPFIDTICSKQYRDRGFRFSDVGQIRNSLARLGQDNLREDEQYLNGEFQGVLPKGRSFEFRLTDNSEVIRGKIGPAILNADELNAHLHQSAKIKVMMTQIGGGKPRYVLTDMPEWIDGN